MAKAQGRKDRSAIAEERARALEPGLSFMTIELDSAAPESVEVSLDGLQVTTAALGVSTAVDIGLHRVEARHRGAVYFSRDFEVAGKQRLVVLIPAPVAAAAPGEPAMAVPAAPAAVDAGAMGPQVGTKPEKTPPQAVPSPAAQERQSLLARHGPHFLLGFGVTALLAGGYFGVRAWQGAREVEQGCPKDPCNPNLKATHETALRDATLSNWLIVLGASTAAIGGYLTIRNANAHARTASWGVAAGPTGASLTWSRSF